MKSSYKGALKGFNCNPFSLMPCTSRHVFIGKKFYMIFIALVVNHGNQEISSKSFIVFFFYFWPFLRPPVVTTSLAFSCLVTAWPYYSYVLWLQGLLSIEDRETLIALEKTQSKAKRFRFALLVPAWTTENFFVIVTLILSYRLHCNCQVVHLNQSSLLFLLFFNKHKKFSTSISWLGFSAKSCM